MKTGKTVCVAAGIASVKLRNSGNASDTSIVAMFPQLRARAATELNAVQVHNKTVCLNDGNSIQDKGDVVPLVRCDGNGAQKRSIPTAFGFIPAADKQLPRIEIDIQASSRTTFFIQDLLSRTK